MSFLNNLFGSKPKVDFTSLLNNGAILLDVRNKEEYRAGHAKQSINIPLGDLGSDLSALNSNVPIITVCQSGMRSSRAAYLLKQRGYEVYNGGSWHNFR